jgi:hypothetical protein
MTDALVDIVMSSIRGGQDAQRLVATVRDGLAPADALLEGLQQVQAAEDQFRLRGFMRGLQKALERSA